MERYTLERYKTDDGSVLGDSGYIVRDRSGSIAYTISDGVGISQALRTATTDKERRAIDAVCKERDRLYAEMMKRHPLAEEWM